MPEKTRDRKSWFPRFKSNWLGTYRSKQMFPCCECGINKKKLAGGRYKGAEGKHCLCGKDEWHLAKAIEEKEYNRRVEVSKALGGIRYDEAVLQLRMMGRGERDLKRTRNQYSMDPRTCMSLSSAMLSMGYGTRPQKRLKHTSLYNSQYRKSFSLTPPTRLGGPLPAPALPEIPSLESFQESMKHDLESSPSPCSSASLTPFGSSTPLPLSVSVSWNEQANAASESTISENDDSGDCDNDYQSQPTSMSSDLLMPLNVEALEESSLSDLLAAPALPADENTLSEFLQSIMESDPALLCEPAPRFDSSSKKTFVHDQENSDMTAAATTTTSAIRIPSSFNFQSLCV